MFLDNRNLLELFFEFDIVEKSDNFLHFRMSVNTAGGNWSSTEGSTCDTMSVALSEMPDLPNASSLMAHHHPQFNASGSHIVPNNPQPPLSPDHHLVNRKDLLEQMGLPPAPIASNHHGRNQPASRYKN